VGESEEQHLNRHPWPGCASRFAQLLLRSLTPRRFVSSNVKPIVLPSMLLPLIAKYGPEADLSSAGSYPTS
jgi:hypothetical protein